MGPNGGQKKIKCSGTSRAADFFNEALCFVIDTNWCRKLSFFFLFNFELTLLFYIYCMYSACSVHAMYILYIFFKVK